MTRSYLGLSWPLWGLLLAAMLLANLLAYCQYDRALFQQSSAKQTWGAIQDLKRQRPEPPSAASVRSYWSHATFTADNALSLSDPNALQRMRDFGVAPRAWSWDATSNTLMLEYDLAP